MFALTDFKVDLGAVLRLIRRAESRRNMKAKPAIPLVSLAFIAFSVLLATSLLSGQQQRDQAVQTTAPPQATASPNDRSPVTSGRTAGERGGISSKAGRLTVHVEKQDLSRVLEEITRQTGLPIILADNMEKQTVSLNIQDLPLDEGMRAILKNADAFFFYGAKEKQDLGAAHGKSLPDGLDMAHLKVVWVYPKGQGAGIEPVAPDRWASTKELQTMLDDSDPKVRGRAFEELIDRQREKAVDILHKALTDPDDQVRTRALYSATNSGVPISPGELEDLAQKDSSPDIRFLALEALEQTPDARQAAQSALADPSPAVQQKAREILGRLDPPPTSPGSSQLLQKKPRK